MELTLSPALLQKIDDRINSGRYRSAEDVVREALSLLEEHEELVAAHTYEIRRQIDDGYASLQRGECVDGDAVFDRLELELDNLDAARR